MKLLGISLGCLLRRVAQRVLEGSVLEMNKGVWGKTI